MQEIMMKPHFDLIQSRSIRPEDDRGFCSGYCRL